MNKFESSHSQTLDASQIRNSTSTYPHKNTKTGWLKKSKYKQIKPWHQLLPYAIGVLASLIASTAIAMDADNDSIDDLIEGQFNGGAAMPLFGNTSFELPSIGNGFSLKNIEAITNWSTGSACQCAEIWSDGFKGVNSHAGKQFAELNSVAANDLNQTITVPEERFTVNYSIAHRGRNSIDTMNIFLGADRPSKVLVDTVSTSNTAWSVYQGSWDKPAGVTTLYIEFRAVGTGSTGNFIDDLQISGVSVDTDGDGTPDYLDDDSDADGIPDSVESTVDADADSIPDFQDADSTGAADDDNDNDGLSNQTEILTTKTDPANSDSDADGLNDGDEVNTYKSDPHLPDTDGDGLSDSEEVNTVGTDPTVADTDGDTLSDSKEHQDYGTNPLSADTDNDGLQDAAELTTLTDPLVADTDADGLTDGAEVNAHGTDPLNADSDGGGALDGDEVLSGSNPANADDDVVDLDSDNDGIPNSVEGDGDQDSDGIANYLDLDSDNDGITDLIEAGGIDVDSNGMVDNMTDADNNGLDDTVAAQPLPIADTDGDGLPDYLDADSDQDGLSDLIEAGGTDSDGNATIDNFQDDDANGLHDALAATPLPVSDTDSDGVANYLDLDSDNDGIFDLLEAGGADSDNNGIVDLFLDDDGDGIPNQADISSIGGEDDDGDGIANIADFDLTGGNDINGNGIEDSFDADPDGDGRAVVLANDGSALPDEDDDDIPDVLDHAAGTSIITGISGSAAGCSITGASRRVDLFFPAILLMLCTLLLRRRHRDYCKPLSNTAESTVEMQQ